MRDLTAEELIVELHPYNEWSFSHTRAAAGEISELVRYLNHATQHPEAMPGPEAVAEVLHLLGQTVRRLPQVLKQAAAGAPEIREQLVAPEGGSLADRLDALGREIEEAAFAGKRLAKARETPPS